MRVIPVLDLCRGRAVHARGGQREAYAPVRSTLVPPEAAGDPLELARAFRAALGCDECYVADLDAITGGIPQHSLVRRLARLGARLLVDAGVAAADRARAALRHGVARVVVGLETLGSFAELAAVARAVGGARLVFSLDLRAGRPVTREGFPEPRSALGLAHAALEAGAGALLVLDLARVGSGRGVDVDFVAALRRALPAVELLAGGGIASPEDVMRLADAGADGALVASALHDGRIGPEHVAALRGRERPRHGAHLNDSR